VGLEVGSASGHQRPSEVPDDTVDEPGPPPEPGVTFNRGKSTVTVFSPEDGWTNS
jgi:hypothetical protein